MSPRRVGAVTTDDFSDVGLGAQPDNNEFVRESAFILQLERDGSCSEAVGRVKRVLGCVHQQVPLIGWRSRAACNECRSEYSGASPHATDVS